MKRRTQLLAVAGFLALAGAPAAGAPRQDHSGCPMHASHAADVDRKGDEVMGFSHEATGHHFRLTSDGGVIEVAANDAADATSRDQIREHLRHVARAFAEGDFSMPHAIHGRVPPGVDAMKEGRAEIRYVYQETDRGARVVISSERPALVDAVHEFLKFQIEDHRTGDPTAVELH